MKKKLLFSVCLVLFAAGLALCVSLPGGPPTQTITSMKGAVCGAGPEPFGCVKVDWTDSVPSGTTITGFKVTVSPGINNQPGVVDNLPASARHADVVVSGSPVAPTGPYSATVTVKYNSSVSASKSENF